MSSMKELLTRIRWAVSALEAQIDLVDYDNKGIDRGRKPILIVEVVSERFKNMPVFSRTLLVDDTIMKRDPKLYQGLELAYECYTMDEYALGFQRKYELH